MQIKYKLLNNGEGFITTRQPQFISDSISFYFDGAPQNATAIFTSSGTPYYRDLKDNTCMIPIDKLEGELSVTVAVIDGKIVPRKWRCEGLLLQKQKSGDMYLLPNDMDIPEKFVDMKIALNNIEAGVVRVEKRLNDFKKRLSETETVYKKAITELYELIIKNKFI